MVNKSADSWLAKFPLHSVILIIYFILYGYSRNLGFFALTDIFSVLGLCFIFAGIIYTIFYLLRGWQAANRMIFVMILAFFLYGHLFTMVLEMLPSYLSEYTIIYGVITAVLVLFLGYAPLDLSKTTYNLNLVMLILGLLGAVQFISQVVAYRSSQQYVATNISVDYVSSPPETLPDVYYLVFDGYPSNAYLESHFGIDNSNFTDALEERGFYVAYDAHSNYTYTFATIASVLNLDFTQNLIEPDPDVSSFVLEDFINDNRVGRIFQGLGYEYINVINGFFNIENSIADVIIDVTSDNNIVEVSAEQRARASMWEYMFLTTALRIIDPNLSAFQNIDNSAGWDSTSRFPLAISILEGIASNPEPTFVYSHVIKPHFPITFDENGNEFFWTHLYDTEAEYRDNQEIHFENQLQHINRLILEGIDDILTQSDNPPIIVIQADHGTQLRRLRTDNSNNPVQILNAVYFPDQNYDALNLDTSPVNTFRLVLNQYFNEDYELLDNSLRYYQPQEHYRRLVFEQIPDGMYEPPFEE